MPDRRFVGIACLACNCPCSAMPPMRAYQALTGRGSCNYGSFDLRSSALICGQAFGMTVEDLVSAADPG